MANIDDDKKQRALLEQKNALADYLDALFREMPEVDEAATEGLRHVADTQNPEPLPVVEEPRFVPDYVELPPEPIFDEAKPLPQLIENHLARQIAELAEVENNLEKESVLPQPKVKVEAEQEAAASEETAPIEVSQPYHPQKEFQVLFFRIGKLNLAVPLEHLSGIIKVGDEKVAAVPGYREWHMGLMKYQGTTVNIVDTAKLIVPKHRRELVEDRRRYRYYILLDERRWGLGCHSVAEVNTLSPEEVKWRSDRTLQPWLAGTVIEKMCALIDVEGFLKMLREYQGKFRKP